MLFLLKIRTKLIKNQKALPLITMIFVRLIILLLFLLLV